MDKKHNPHTKTASVPVRQRKTKVGIFFALLGLVVGIAALSILIAPVINPPPKGPAAPPFSVESLSGKSISLESLRGSYVVLEWISPVCACVQQHYSGPIQNIHRKAVKSGIRWILVNSSAPGRSGYMTTEETVAWMTRNGVEVGPENFIIDTLGDLGRAFQAKATPTVVLIGPDGRTIYQGALDDNPEGNASKSSTATCYVMEAFESARGGRSVVPAFRRAYGCPIKYQDPSVVEAVGAAEPSGAASPPKPST